MNERIGINRSKKIDSLNRRVKVPAITQRDYYISDNDEEEELIDFLQITSTDDSNDVDISKYNYLDEECDCQCDDCDCEYDNCCEDDDYCYDDNCCCNMFNHFDKKTAIYAGVGALIGSVVIYKLLKRRR